MHHRRPLALALFSAASLSAAFALAPLSAGCSPAADDDATPTCSELSTSSSFTPFERDFQGFTRWASYDLGQSAPTITAPNDSSITIHSAGKRVGYMNCKPAAGATQFPVGTMLVKVAMAEKPETEWQIFGMVKRGGGYNPEGGDWEWFELRQNDKSQTTFVWRGLGPPIGEGYTANGGSCTDCHRSAKDTNDFVLGTALKLSDLAASK